MLKKLRIDKILIFLIIFVSLLILTISGIKMLDWKMGKKSAINQTEKILEFIDDVDIVTDNENTQIIPAPDLDLSNPYYDYIKMNMINVNLTRLKALNKDVKGWIQVNGTNVNYPFVQTNDNEYYLKHSFDREYNSAGWVFMDYRNNITNNDKNIILYAHGRADRTMFGSLNNILTEEWLNNSENHILKLSTDAENSLWQVFSVYTILTTSDYLQIDFKEQEFKKFNDMLIARSIYKFNTEVLDNDHIITLSTCYSNTERLVLHAKLIKKQTKYKIDNNKNIYYT